MVVSVVAVFRARRGAFKNYIDRLFDFFTPHSSKKNEIDQKEVIY